MLRIDLSRLDVIDFAEVFPPEEVLNIVFGAGDIFGVIIQAPVLVFSDIFLHISADEAQAALVDMAVGPVRQDIAEAFPDIHNLTDIFATVFHDMSVRVDVLPALHDDCEVFIMRHDREHGLSVQEVGVAEIPPGILAAHEGLDHPLLRKIQCARGFQVAQLQEPCADPEIRKLQLIGQTDADILIQGSSVAVLCAFRLEFSDCVKDNGMDQGMHVGCGHHQGIGGAVGLFFHKIERIMERPFPIRQCFALFIRSYGFRAALIARIRCGLRGYGRNSAGIQIHRLC